MVFVIYCHLMYCFAEAYLDPKPALLFAGFAVKKLVIGRLGPWWPSGALVALGGYAAVGGELSLIRLVLCLVGEDFADVKVVGVGDFVDAIEDVI